jgi:rhodanese-related sulfurtransferase
MRFREMKLRKDPACPICSENRTITRLIDYEEFCGLRNTKPTETKTNMTNSMPSALPEMTVEELKAKLDAKEDVFVLDVREPHEYQICNIGGHLIPLGDLQKRQQELDPEKHIVVHCRSGVRSAKAADFLRQQGFEKVQNLAGGILAWADRIDKTMPKY